MATIAYMKIESLMKGCLSAGCNTLASMGNSFQEGHEDEITVLGFNHSVAWDNRSVHSPVQITKKVDKASPVLAQACSDGTELTCTITFYRHAPIGGTQEPFYEVKLTGAIIRRVSAEMPHVVNSGEAEMEEVVSIAYRDIQWKHLSATTNAFSSWLNGLDKLKELVE